MEKVGLLGFKCPKGMGDVEFSFCENGCPKNCRPLPLLMFFRGHEREVIPGTFSTTEILKPLQAIYYGRRNSWFKDPDDLMNQAFGTAMHYLLEDGADDITVDRDKHITEKHWSITVPTTHGDITLHGTPDYYDARTKTLYDYKTAGAFSLRYKKRDLMAPHAWYENDYEAQLNIYRAYKFPEAEEIMLFFMALGWTKMDLAQKKMFDDVLPGVSKTEEFSLPVENAESVKKWVGNRIQMIADCEHDPKLIPPCSKQDQWDRGKGPVRCNGYCSAASICPQFNGGKNV